MASTWTLFAEDNFSIASGAGAVDYALPGPPAARDLVVVVLASDSDLTTFGITEAGYTRETEPSGLPGSDIGYKVMGATPDTVVEITDNADEVAVAIEVWRPPDGYAATGSVTFASADGATGMPDAPNLTAPGTDLALILNIGILDDDDDATAVPATSEGWDDYTVAVSGSGDGSGATAMVAGKHQATAAAVNPGIWTGAGDDAWEAFTYAFEVKPSLDAATGTFTATDPIDTRFKLTIPGDAGTFAVTGSDVFRAWIKYADPGLFSVTGTAATLTVTSNVSLDAETVAFTVTGTAANLEWGRSVSAESASFTISGTAATPEWGRKLSAETDSYTLTGTAVTLTVGVPASLDAETSAFTITGTAATFSLGISPGVWEELSDAFGASWLAPSTTFATGNFNRFIDADPLLDAERGVDFNNTFSTENPWVFTVYGPVTFTPNRNDP